MTKLAAVMTGLSHAMNKMSSAGYLSVKELLTSPMWKYAHTCPVQKHPKAPPTLVLEGDENYHEHFNIAGNLLITKDLTAVWGEIDLYIDNHFGHLITVYCL